MLFYSIFVQLTGLAHTLAELSWESEPTHKEMRVQTFTNMPNINKHTTRNQKQGCGRWNEAGNDILGWCISKSKL